MKQTFKTQAEKNSTIEKQKQLITNYGASTALGIAATAKLAEFEAAAIVPENSVAGATVPTSFATQELKDATVEAQIEVVNSTPRGPDRQAAKEVLATLEDAEVTG